MLANRDGGVRWLSILDNFFLKISEELSTPNVDDRCLSVEFRLCRPNSELSADGSPQTLELPDCVVVYNDW
jgi:hypothetical protein